MDMENIQAMGVGVAGMFLICICYYCLCCRKSNNSGGKEIEEEEYMAADPEDYRASKEIELQPTQASETQTTAKAFQSFNSMSTDDELVPVGGYGGEGESSTGVNKRLPNDLQEGEGTQGV